MTIPGLAKQGREILTGIADFNGFPDGIRLTCDPDGKSVVTDV
jgi:hypothetical protein